MEKDEEEDSDFQKDFDEEEEYDDEKNLQSQQNYQEQYKESILEEEWNDSSKDPYQPVEDDEEQEEIIRTIKVTEQTTGLRVDKILKEEFSQYSRSKIQQWLENGLVKVNDKVVNQKQKFYVGEKIQVQIIGEKPFKLVPENIPIEVIYEDQYFFAVNKPASMVVHPGAGNWTGTLVNALLGSNKQLSIDESRIKPGIVHRLDKQTSGVILISKTSESHFKLQQLFQDRVMHKEYLTLIWGQPFWEETVVEGYINRNPIDRQKMQFDTNLRLGKYSKTKFEVEQKYGHISLLRAYPETGRMHQIRVHLKSLNFPVFGDETYGGGSQIIKRFKSNIIEQYEKIMIKDVFALHAHSIKFNHPFTDEEITITAALPQHFHDWIEQSEKIYNSIGEGYKFTR